MQLLGMEKFGVAEDIWMFISGVSELRCCIGIDIDIGIGIGIGVGVGVGVGVDGVGLGSPWF